MSSTSTDTRLRLPPGAAIEAWYQEQWTPLGAPGAAFELPPEHKLRLRARGADLAAILDQLDADASARVTALDVLPGSRLGPEEAAPLARLSCLQQLDLSHCRIAGDAVLPPLPALTRLELRATTPEEALLRSATALPALAHLDLEGCDVGDPAMELLAACPMLTSLRLTGTAITDAGLPCLAAMPSLRELHLPGLVGDDGIGVLAQSRGLESLWLGSTSAGHESLAMLKELPSLSALELPPRVDGSIEGILTGFPALRHLSVTSPWLQPVAYWGLGTLATLESLVIPSAPTFDALKQLARLPRLHHLALLHPGTSLEALWALAELPALRRLRLRAPALGDDCAALLGSIKRLESLALLDSNLTWEGLRVLRDALPTVRITHDPRAIAILPGGFSAALAISSRDSPTDTWEPLRAAGGELRIGADSELALRGAGPGTPDLAPFTGLARHAVREVALRAVPLDERLVAQLHKLPRLATLSLSGCSNLDALFSQPPLPAVRALDLSNTALAATDLLLLSEWESIEELDLSFTSTTDDQLDRLLRLPRLGAICLRETPVTEEGRASARARKKGLSVTGASR